MYALSSIEKLWILIILDIFPSGKEHRLIQNMKELLMTVQQMIFWDISIRIKGESKVQDSSKILLFLTISTLVKSKILLLKAMKNSIVLEIWTSKDLKLQKNKFQDSRYHTALNPSRN